MMSVGSLLSLAVRDGKQNCNVFFVGKWVLRKRFCFAQISYKRNMKCQSFAASGHLAKNRRKPKQNKNYSSFAK